ncbi:MAG: hypothetical protein LC798_13040 [Chloroflexi bacterium]|nr:hypothetical protein [Chloroflexota bacterium]
MSNIHSRPLGAVVPPDDAHSRKYPFRAVAREVAPLTAEQVAERLRGGVVSTLPSWHWSHDQGWIEGSCVGHATAMERAICNIAQNRLLNVRPFQRRYDPITPWRLAKGRDEWTETVAEDDDGTSARACYDVWREFGGWRITRMVLGADGRPRAPKVREPHAGEGIEVNRWALTVDEMRLAFASGIPAIAIGTPWMSKFDYPIAKPGRFGRPEYHLPSDPAAFGPLRGYHETCLYGADDARGGFWLKNSWGRDFPLVLLPYETMEWCFTGWSDAALVTDR